MLWCLDFISHSGFENEALFRELIRKVSANEQNKHKFVDFILANLNKRGKIIKLMAWITLDIQLIEMTRIFIEGGAFKIISDDLVN